MSPIGKIFLLINFGLAFGFLFWASTAVSTNAKWKSQFEAEKTAHEATQAELQGNLSGLQIDLTNERDAKDARTSERDQAMAESSRNREELDAEKRANDQLRADIAKIQATLEGYNQTIQSLTSQKDAAIAEARDLERERDAANQGSDASEQARADAEEALREAEATIAQLERQLSGAKTQIAGLDGKLQVAISNGFDVSGGQPDIDARVLQVDTSVAPGLVALNVGSNAGVKRGMTFQVFNGAAYKGYVRVENVHDNMCSALIMGLVDGAAIGQGDSASTNL